MTSDFNVLDWFLIVLVGGSTLFGFRAGFARVAIGFAAGMLGIVLGFWFYERPATWFAGLVNSPTAASALGFLTVFAGVIIAGGVLARVLVALFRWAGLGWLDRLLGAGAGFLRGMAVVVGVVTPLVAFASDPTPKFLEDSQLVPYTVAFGHVMVAVAPKAVREQFENKAESLKSLWKGEFKKVLPGLPGGAERGKPVPMKKESY